MARFSDEQIRRYSRQILLREVGGSGQTRFLSARPTLLCIGAVGEVAADYLWRAGVTELTLLAPSEALAAQLSWRLRASGYPGEAAQVHAAGRSPSAEDAPGFSLLWLEAQAAVAQPLLWAGCGAGVGFVGQGSAALRRIAQSHAAEMTAEASAGAMVVGSALALLALQRLCGMSGAPGERPEFSAEVWRIDLDSPTLPQWAGGA